ncbi:hypothetical protein M3592_03530 [Priestia aryabhattai]|uniref:DUF6792 domain-containing protein n=1 Tax=Priestia TaxID=2800373 RepID=UPI00203AF423|nr:MULTISPECIES: DUF6792 domain-containing protein [Priestia]MCM2974503.1 hypothetical protein [Priestia aryabhattai]MED3883855.1 hypothetical protein [Priestia aryabhattai]MED4258765.1 hypothetical protein [Priestia aryabhattai]
MSEKPLLSNDIRNKITQLEYSGLSGKEKEITRIYKEATGENPPNFKIYSSVEMGIGNKSGFDGAAIHFHDKKHNINEVYYVFRGTEPSKDFGDVVYDALGIGAGKSTQQINDAKKMYQQVETKIKSSDEKLKRYGDGHSLGGHLIVTLSLITKSFKDIRALNDAPVNLKQLEALDKEFELYVFHQTGKKDGISSKKLTELANTYYEKQKATISHTWVKGEPMHAQSFPNSWYAGNKVTMLGDLDTEEMINIGKYPFQKEAKWNPVYMIDQFRYNLGVKTTLGGLGFVNDHVKQETLLNLPETRDQYLESVKRYPFLHFGEIKAGIGVGAVVMVNTFTSPGATFQLVKGISQSKQAKLHGINYVVKYTEANAMKTYYQVFDSGSQEEILLDYEQMKKFVYYCANAIKDKEANLNTLKQYLHSEINEVFEAKKKKLKMKISREEASPQSFMEKADKDGATLAWFGQTRVAEKVTFDKTFDPLDDSVFTPVEEIISSIQEEVTYYQKFLEAFFQNFEKMMEADESVASDIKSMKEVVGGI